MTQQTVRDPGSGILDIDTQAYEYHLVAKICIPSEPETDSIVASSSSSICTRKLVVSIKSESTPRDVS